ncbi:hypothetical protein SMICM304S_04724 [Streptomyces microflavus]
MNDLGAGFGYLMKGQRWVAQLGRWFGFGLLPGLITLVVYAGALVGLGYGADDFVAWATPFADDWSSPWIGLLRTTLTAFVFVFGLFLAVMPSTRPSPPSASTTRRVSWPARTCGRCPPCPPSACAPW